MKRASKIYVAGHRGLVGSALVRKLTQQGYTNLILRTSKQLDLRRQDKVERFFAKERPEYVFLAAGKVGGILANSTYRAEFIYDNLMIASNVIHASYKYGVRKLLNLGSSCIYPKLAPQPLKEEYLLTGPLEPTNEAYAVAKIAAIKLCRYYNEQYGTDFISVMPTNLYGPNDNYDLKTSHVLPAMIRKFHEAKARGQKEVVFWGTGKPMREFLHVDDLVDACILLLKNCKAVEIGELVNIGTGKELRLDELAALIARIVGYRGKIQWNKSKLDGTPRKLLDIKLISRLGFKPQIDLESGIRSVYKSFEKETKSF